jgi:ankyrin repeat protein
MKQIIDKPIYKAFINFLQQDKNIILQNLHSLDLVNLKNSNGVNLLHFACSVATLEAVIELVNYFQDKNYNLNILSNRDSTLLHCASVNANHSFVISKWLIENKVSDTDINAKDKDGITPLHLACMSRNPSLELIKYLVEDKGANINALAKTNLPFTVAANNKQASPELIKYLFNKTSAELIDLEKYKNDLPFLKMEKCLVLKEEFYTFFSQSDEEIIKQLNTKSIDITTSRVKNGKYLFEYACMLSNLKVVKHFIDEIQWNIKQYSSSFTPLHYACINTNKDSSLELIKYFVEEKGFIVTDKNHTRPDILHFACMNKNPNIEAIEYLLKKGVDINLGNRDERTALNEACKNPYSSFKLVQFLVENKADIINNIGRLKTPIHNTSIHFACENHNLNIDTIRYLIEKGNIDVNLLNSRYSDSPLHSACKSRHPSLEIIEYLIEEKGADVNFVGAYKSIPFEISCLNGSSGFFKYYSSQIYRENDCTTEYSKITFNTNPNPGVVKYLFKKTDQLQAADILALKSPYNESFYKNIFKEFFSNCYQGFKKNICFTFLASLKIFAKNQINQIIPKPIIKMILLKTQGEEEVYSEINKKFKIEGIEEKKADIMKFTSVHVAPYYIMGLNELPDETVERFAKFLAGEGDLENVDSQ